MYSIDRLTRKSINLILGSSHKAKEYSRCRIESSRKNARVARRAPEHALLGPPAGKRNNHTALMLPNVSSAGSAGEVALTEPLETRREINPQELSEADWPKPYVWTEDCVGCEICSAVCPFQALGMGELNNETIAGLYDPKACVGCGLCEQACPVHAVQLVWPQAAKKSA